MSVLSASAKSLPPQDSKSPAPQNDKEILQQCRAAVQELVFKREQVSLLEKKVAELQKLSDLQGERNALLEQTIKQLDLALKAADKAEGLVAQLRANFEKQVAACEKELSNQRRKVRLWQLLSAVAVVFALITGAKSN
jgi:hypothetical protein